MTEQRRLSWSMRFALMISGVFAGAAVLAGAIAFVLLRLLYGALYMYDYASARSVVWFAAVLSWVAMYFVG